jgi:hypothetical protein
MGNISISAFFGGWCQGDGGLRKSAADARGYTQIENWRSVNRGRSRENVELASSVGSIFVTAPSPAAALIGS